MLSWWYVPKKVFPLLLINPLVANNLIYGFERILIDEEILKILSH
jgi:hypothetical protein